MFTDDQIRPRHLSTGKCLCQFIEEHFSNYQKCNTDKYDKTTSIEHNYTKVNLVINNKRQQDEIPIKAKSVGNNLQMKRPTIPTLSDIVRRQNRPLYTKIDFDHVPVNHEEEFTSHQPNGFISSLASERQNQIETSRQSGGQMSPVSSPEVSLEMEGDLISRSDDLVRKLRLLLELRKNELNGLDGSLFSAISYKTPQSIFQLPHEEDEQHREAMKHCLETQESPEVMAHPPLHETKKFFHRRDGLFFFPSSGPKKTSQPDTNTRSHILEIC